MRARASFRITPYDTPDERHEAKRRRLRRPFANGRSRPFARARVDRDRPRARTDDFVSHDSTPHARPRPRPSTRDGRGRRRRRLSTGGRRADDAVKDDAPHWTTRRTRARGERRDNARVIHFMKSMKRASAVVALTLAVVATRARAIEGFTKYSEMTQTMNVTASVTSGAACSALQVRARRERFIFFNRTTERRIRGRKGATA